VDDDGSQGQSKRYRMSQEGQATLEEVEMGQGTKTASIGAKVKKSKVPLEMRSESILRCPKKHLSGLEIIKKIKTMRTGQVRGCTERQELHRSTTKGHIDLTLSDYVIFSIFIVRK